MAENKKATVTKGIEEERKNGFWVDKEACWERCHCPGAVQADCPANRYQFLPCWEIEGTYCKLDDRGADGKDTMLCQKCQVYLKYGQGKEIKLKLFGRGIATGFRVLEEITV